MSASTSLIGFNLANTFENKDKEGVPLLKRNTENSILIKTLRSKEIAAIQEIFSNIRKKLEDTDEKDLLMNAIFKDLLDASNELEKTLLDEINDPTKNITRARITALHYQSALNDVLNNNKNLADKTHSISEFRNHARGSKISNSKRQIIGAAVGALFSNALFFGVLAVTGSFALAMGPIGLGVLGIGVLICIGIGATLGIMAANRLAKNHEEKRGRDVSKHLDRLAVAKNRFFLPPQKPKAEIVPMASMQL